VSLFGSGGGSAGTVEVDVEGDFSKFERDLKGKGAAAGGRFGTSFGQSFGSKIAAIGGAYLGAQFLKNTISQASDLAEATNVTGLAFGEARAQADAFAKSSDTAIGMSESATRALQAQLGNVIVGFGAAQSEAVSASEDLIRRAADIGSAWNAGTDEVSQAIISAFTTSTEPIRKFGVIIDQAAIKARALELGLIGAGDELDNNSKRLAVTSLIMEQTNNVAGDFLNTQDGVANSSKQVTAMWENMQAQLGQALLPLLSQLLGMMKTLGPDGMKLVIMGAALTLAFVKITQAGQALSGVFSLLAANPWVLAGLAVVAVGVAIYKNWDEVKAAGGRLVDWFRSAAGTVRSVFSGIADAVSGPFRAAFNAIATAWNATVGKLAFSVPSWVPLLGGKGWDVPDIPTLASGAVLTKPTLNIAGEYAGARANPEVVSPVSLMRRTFLEALDGAGASSSAPISVELHVHGGIYDVKQLERYAEPMARAIERERLRAARSTGRPEVRG
jgi:hypothetical protein